MQALLFQGKKLGICIQLYTEFINRSPPRPLPELGREQALKYAVFSTNAYGERPQTIFKTKNLHFCTILRWEPFHFSHPTVFRHPELDSGSQGRGLSTSIWRFRNKFGMTAYFRHPAIKQPQNRSPPWPSPTRGRSSRRNTSVFRTNADGEQSQNSLAALKPPFQRNLVKNPQNIMQFH